MPNPGRFTAENPSPHTLYMREWRKKNPDYNRIYLRKRSRERRQRVLTHYGGHCFCCGEDRYEFLCLDHVNGGGEKHRAEVGQGSRMIDWIIDNDFPDLFQVSCHNCNQARGYYGYCPHEQ